MADFSIGQGLAPFAFVLAFLLVCFCRQLGLNHEAGVLVVLCCFLGWVAVGRCSCRSFVEGLIWHPLAKAVCFEELEAELTNVHATHHASCATFVFVLDCCRVSVYEHFTWWHRMLLWGKGVGVGSPTSLLDSSYKGTRPNFFQVFACESGRPAFTNLVLQHGFFAEALVKTLRGCRTHRCTLDYVFEGICLHMHGIYGRGKQRICVHSTAYASSKSILFLDPTETTCRPAPTLLASIPKSRLMQWSTAELDIFRKHRASQSLRRRKRLVNHPSLSEDARAIMILQNVRSERTGRRHRFLKTAEFVSAIRGHSVRPCNIQGLLCMINLTQAKYLCDKATILVVNAAFANPSERASSFQSVERKLGRVERLVDKVLTVVDACEMEPYFRGKTEEVLAGSLAVRILKKMMMLLAQPQIRQGLHREMQECASHFCQALHAYAEGSLEWDASRLAVIWHISLMFSALVAGDIRELQLQINRFHSSLLAFEEHCVDYRQSWVIKTVLSFLRLSIRRLCPSHSLILNAARRLCQLVPNGGQPTRT